MTKLRPLGIAALVLSVLLAPVATTPDTASGETAGPTVAADRADPRPDIVLITTDDQTLSDLRTMSRTRRVFAGAGTRFDGISSHPLCCPARAEMLTGQFAHNNGVYSNRGPHGGYPALDASSTLATWLHDAGYSTAFLGKFLNGYRGSFGAPPGWDEWHPTVRGVYNYTDFTVVHNERRVRYRNAYQTDVFADRAVRVIRSFSAAEDPFFVWQSFVAPHGSCPPTDELTCWGPPVPAPRHAALFPDDLPPAFSDPAFNEADVRDKPQRVQRRALLSDAAIAHLVDVHRSRLRALQAVDEAVGRIVRALRSAGRLRNTLLVFTSDNGYLLGEHRLSGKNVPYEPALSVPLLIRGPGFPTGGTTDEVAAMVDLAPTFAAAAGVRPGITTDGRNLAKVVDGSAPGWRTLLIQAGANPARDDIDDWFFRGVRTDRYTYATYEATGEEELYDRRRDPSQLENVADSPRYRRVRADLAGRLAKLEDCAGNDCRRTVSGAR